MSHELSVHAVGRELGHQFSESPLEEVQAAHTRYLHEAGVAIRPLPGASHPLPELRWGRVPVAAASRFTRETANGSRLKRGREVPVVTRDEVPFAKPDPGLLLAEAGRVEAPIGSCIVVGDSVWDILAARRAGALAVRVLSGGRSRPELAVAGAFRARQEAAELVGRPDELGIGR